MHDTNRDWKADPLPDQSGRRAVITGANSGTGFATARMLASCGADIVMACRNVHSARTAAEEIAAEYPKSMIDVVELDLSSLASVARAAGEIRDRYRRIDLLFNNAGVMWTPPGKTSDGFETHIGVNHLGHFAFTAQLLDRMCHVEDSRIVTVTSVLHRAGQIHFTDLNLDRGYRPTKAYNQSKLANLMFAYALQDWLERHEARTISVAAHPGIAATALFRHVQGETPGVAHAAIETLFHDANGGALASIRAATDPAESGGHCYGPSGFMQLRGGPTRVATSRRSRSRAPQRLLWRASENLTGAQYLRNDAVSRHT